VYQPPIAKDDYDTADIDTTLDVPASGVLDNDTVDDDATITVISFTINGTTYNTGDTANLPEGDFTLLPDGSFIFVPAPGYTGNVPPIDYTISDGTETSSATLFLTVEDTEDLIEFIDLSSCNQGFGPDGNYKIEYTYNFKNNSTARDYHPSSLIQNIQISKDLDGIYGSGCVISIDDISITTSVVEDFVEDPYPLDFDVSSVNPDFLDATSDNLFSVESVNNAILYPRQTINISYCVTVDPFCDGRPNPTPSGSGVDFETILNLTSSTGEDETELLLTDFHTTEAIITAELNIPVNQPTENPDGSFDYINSVTITNEGIAIANNVNFNMGLDSFLNNGVIFNDLTISQTSGPPVTINNNYDGDTSTFLLMPNNSLAPGETIVLEIFHLIAPIIGANNNNFNQVTPSQTQGPLDGFDEDTPDNRRQYTYAIWEDNLGNHLDRYYASGESTAVNDQCDCVLLGMSFSFLSTAACEKTISNIDTAPDGILEHEELTFEINFTNTSDEVNLNNLQVEESLFDICDGNIISLTAPEIISSTATTNPNLNPSFDGVTDINIFDGNSGLLKVGESITLELTVVLNEDCIGQNTIDFFSTDPLGSVTNATAFVDVNATTDSDNDGISNAIDIDDDNDTIPDILEYDGVDPLGDHDDDGIPNYRDTDFGLDENADGIVDSFDFDGDGIPNHFDLDSDNDGIFDIVEAGNGDNDTNGTGQTNNSVGENGLDNTVESDDTENADITYTITNTDTDPNLNYLDIDSDDDGIVDNIEAQATDNYIAPNNVYNDFGVDTAYEDGLSPVDTDDDSLGDYMDFNSDDDLRNDDIEGWDFNNDGTPEIVASGTDEDNDGLDDAYDNDTSQVNPTNGQVPEDFPNVDYDVTFERDWREVMAIVVFIDDVSAVEGNQLEFTISLVTFNDNTVPAQSTTPVEITLFTADGSENAGDNNTAVSPFDYESVSDIQIVIPPLSSTSQLTITSFDDDISELNEFLTLNADITSDNTVNAEAKGIGTIIDDELPPNITMNNDTVSEGEELQYNIEMSGPSSIPTEVSIVTLDFTATSPDDFTALSAVFTIDGTTNPAEPNLSTSFSIPTFEDNLNEPDAEVLDVLGDVISNNIGIEDLTKTGTILDTDPLPLLVITDDTVVEGSTLNFTITLLNENNEPMANYEPINFDLETVDITTTLNNDYIYFFQNASIPALQSSLNQNIPTIDDNLNEETETMYLRATITSGEVANTSSIINGLGTIKDNDIPNLFTPNNDGRSDVFRIDGLEDFPNFELTIFDRWGGEIYNYNNNGNINPRWWDGTHNGDPVVEGVYFYILDYNDGSTKPKTGFIQLMR
ncbi:MAG: gliding motility-associated C-terminal domain-containing protein, partial [Psychroflexus sp.]|nr:gliding motility-associated C-terminal domain-containing protein [Psychroflexus sp.]